MSMVTKAIGFAKKIKHRFADGLRARKTVFLSPVRRIERVALHERVCAMTFDDGPCRLPSNPSEDQTPLTLKLLQTLEQYGAVGTFDIVGDTSGNYPDCAGKEGSASWGGVAFDHYPDFGKDRDGGARFCPELVERILSGGHEITSHTWSHVLFGPKPLVYGHRRPMPNLDAVISDLRTMHTHMQEKYGYTIRLSRPPHYVDRTKDGFSAYDAYAVLGYDYMAASFDGAGWLPLANYESEVAATVAPMRQALENDPDCLCGQIIFQKDGYNMARRSPVADGLGKQLALLRENGYRVVSVSELLKMCPFLDVSPDDPVFPAAKSLLEKGFCVAFSDNTVRKNTPLTRAALAMMAYGKSSASRRIDMVRQKQSPCKDVSYRHPYAAAVEAAIKSGALPLKNGRFFPGKAPSSEDFARFLRIACEKTEKIAAHPKTHGEALLYMD